MAQRLLHVRVMRTAADRFAPPPDLDEGWRDLISSAPPPPPPLPRDASVRINVPVGTTTDRQGCVARVQFGGDIVLPPEPEKPSFDAADRRLWKVAGGLMGLATLVLLVLGLLTFRNETAVTATAPAAQPAAAPAQMVAARANETEIPAAETIGVGSARPLIAQHALRHSSTKHGRKHKKIAER
jgi:hypothetical protein